MQREKVPTGEMHGAWAEVRVRGGGGGWVAFPPPPSPHSRSKYLAVSIWGARVKAKVMTMRSREMPEYTRVYR
jgi:hypothetical protein